MYSIVTSAQFVSQDSTPDQPIIPSGIFALLPFLVGPSSFLIAALPNIQNEPKTLCERMQDLVSVSVYGKGDPSLATHSAHTCIHPDRYDTLYQAFDDVYELERDEFAGNHTQ